VPVSCIFVNLPSSRCQDSLGHFEQFLMQTPAFHVSSVAMSWLAQIRRYATVGVGSAVTDLTIYGLLLHFLGLPPEGANLISRPCGGLFSFTGNKLWTFNRRQLAGTRREFTRFWIVWIVSYGLSELLVWLFHLFFLSHNAVPQALSSLLLQGMGVHADMIQVLPKICAEGLVCIGLFLSHRFWTFRHQPERPVGITQP
jgi:putative flippase GtrA